MTEGQRLDLVSSFRDEPAKFRRLAVAYGFAPAIILLAMGTWFLVAFVLGPARELRQLFAVVVSLAMVLMFWGFASLFTGRKAVTLDEGFIGYRDAWKQVRIPLGRIVAAARGTGEAGEGVVSVISASGGFAGAGHGFPEADKERLWSELRRLLSPQRVEFREGLSLANVTEFAKAVEPRLLPESERSRDEVRRTVLTGVASVVGFGAVFTLAAFLLATVAYVTLRDRQYAILAFVLGVTVWFVVCLASVVLGRTALLLRALVAFGATVALFGAYLLAAGVLGFDASVGSQGIALGAILLLFGLFISFLASRTRPDA